MSTGSEKIIELANRNSTIAVIALGSNLGDRFHNIELALRLLELPEAALSQEDIIENNGEDVKWKPFSAVVDTSFLYETSPMYVTDQPSFINCACLIQTDIPPVLLLRVLKHIETVVGRVPSTPNGPRAVDLDLLLYGSEVVDTRPLDERSTLENLNDQLVVPHPRMVEREFVLRPLNDMIPDYIHPVHQKSLSQLLHELPEEDHSMRRVVPFPRYPLPTTYSWTHPVPPVPPTLTHWTYPLVERPSPKPKTHLMATLNTTPDSFSDGAVHTTLTAALAYAQSSVTAGASILDVGGYSTKPGAAFVSPEEETQRVVPFVHAVRERHTELLVSVDTFRADVARTAIRAGANCINDVYAFTGRAETFPPPVPDAKAEQAMEEMKAVARELAVPAVLMHSRADAAAHKDYTMYPSVVEGVQRELGAKVERIVKGRGAVRRWMVIVDPGVGFSKTLEGNLEALRDARRIVGNASLADGTRNSLRGYPQLIGASRKSFLGAILKQGEHGRETGPKERGWATATAVACAVQQGALVVRVHDTQEMADVLAVADALWA
ncbi:hypothetical protein H0H81_000003 [Sphagnurus paluster]|uniref:Pterin-binding domain-containing protein n=1 Tax=Sphagnurus paluster TaxID=117069 RepID=A0A9P7G0B7_9AGAR|nr:hypothetical protein H0H81_000003 [Sphagnurus paluster]